MRTGGTQGQPAPPAGPAPGTPAKPPSGAHRTVPPDVLLWVPIQIPRGYTAEAGPAHLGKGPSLGWHGGWPSRVVARGWI